MDPFSHLALTALIMDRQPATLMAGLGPDLPWYLLYPAWLLGRRGVRAALSSGDWPLPPRWMQEAHYAGHSLFVLALALGLARLIWPRRALRPLAGAWLLHILLDIPTHARRRMGTRFLWPLSAWCYDGISWADYVARAIVALLGGGT